MKFIAYTILLFLTMGLFLTPVRANAHITWYPTYWSSTLGYTGFYLAFGWPMYSAAYYRAAYNPTATMAYYSARNQVETIERILYMGEGKKQIWLNQMSQPQPIIPAPIPPENLEAPEIVVNSTNGELR